MTRFEPEINYVFLNILCWKVIKGVTDGLTKASMGINVIIIDNTVPHHR